MLHEYGNAQETRLDTIAEQKLQKYLCCQKCSQTPEIMRYWGEVFRSWLEVEGGGKRGERKESSNSWLARYWEIDIDH